jgi:hypothetical protein
MIEEKNCLQCGTIFVRQDKHKFNWQLIKFCSKKCSYTFAYENRRKVKRQRDGFQGKNQIAYCIYCKKEFKPKTSANKCCSVDCSKKYHYSKISKNEYIIQRTKQCLLCKKNFFKKKLGSGFCSKVCLQIYAERKRNSKAGGRSKEKAKRFNISVDDYLSLQSKCSICVIDVLINIHHIIEKKKRGKDIIENYLPLCPLCHKLYHSGRSYEEIKNYLISKGISILIRQDFDIPVKLGLKQKELNIENNINNNNILNKGENMETNVELKCKFCNYQWKRTNRVKRTIKATCPNCSKTLNIQECIVKNKMSINSLDNNGADDPSTVSTEEQL